MVLRKHKNADNEIVIFDDAVIHKRGEIWQFRLWLRAERKYVRKSLQTASATVATEKAKELYLQLYADQKSGKSYYSLTVAEGVDRYSKHRQKDVDAKLIVAGRLVTIRAHLLHWQACVGSNTKIRDLTKFSCEDYFLYRVTKSAVQGKQVTIENEQSTINACMKYLYKNGLSHFSEFEYKKLPKIDRKSDDVRRATFTNDEYNDLVKFLRSYTARRKNNLDDKTYIFRMLMRHWLLIAANSGMRTGEQRQLRWSDVKIEQHEVDGKSHILARISIRRETTKVRLSRTFLCRGGEYFERWRKIQNAENKNDLIFSINGRDELAPRTFNKYFHEIVAAAGVKEIKERKVVPYSLRHFMITQRVLSGLNYSDVAEMCGTSSTQVEITYNHLNDSRRLTSAVATYRRTKDGLIIPLLS